MELLLLLDSSQSDPRPEAERKVKNFSESCYRIYCNSRLLGYTRKGFIHLEKDQRRANRKRPTTFHMFTCMFICRVILLLVIRARTSNKILTPQNSRPNLLKPRPLDLGPAFEQVNHKTHTCLVVFRSNKYTIPSNRWVFRLSFQRSFFLQRPI